MDVVFCATVELESKHAEHVCVYDFHVPELVTWRILVAAVVGRLLNGSWLKKSLRPQRQQGRVVKVEVKPQVSLCICRQTDFTSISWCTSLSCRCWVFMPD